MARHPKYTEEDLRAAEAFNSFVGPASKRKKSGKLSDSQFAKALTEVQERRLSGEWKDIRPVHFVALYVIQHEMTYGVQPTELDPTKRVHACGYAMRLLAKEFNGNTVDMILFMRWAWEREREREAWRRMKGSDGGRLTWQWQFQSQLVTEYRIHLARKQKRA